MNAASIYALATTALGVPAAPAPSNWLITDDEAYQIAPRWLVR